MGWRDAPLLGDSTQPKSRWAEAPLVEEEDTYWNRISKFSEQQFSEIGEMVSNVPGSALNAASGMANVVAHPIQTFQNLYNAGPEGIGNYFAERYGSLDAASETLKKDPIGFLSDLSTFATGGGGLAIGAGKLAGKFATAGTKASAAAAHATQAGRAMQKIGKHIDPITGTVPERAAKGLAKNFVGKALPGAVGVTTGAGAQPLKIAAEAGFESVGGDKTKGQAFMGSLNKTFEPEDVVASARGSVAKIKQNRSLAYSGPMAQIMADPTPLSFTSIDQAMSKAKLMRSFKAHGYTRVAPVQRTVMAQMNKTINTWKTLARKKGSGFTTMGAFDNLKRELNDVRMGYQHGTPQRAAADIVYNSVRETINGMSKTKRFTWQGSQYNYGDVMRAYDQATDQIDELERTLSLGQNSTVDTALRKLQSVMRDTAHTNYGARTNLVQLLVDNGADNLMEHLAGQALTPIFKPGLASQVGLMGTGGAIATGALAPKFIATLALYSPNVMGRAAYAGGKGAAAVARPVMALQKFMNKYGVSYRGIGQGVRMTGEISEEAAEVQEDFAGLKEALHAQVQKMGYNVHPSVIDRIATDLNSQSIADVDRAIQAISANPRLMQLIEGETDGGNL